ncbi:uncharacterized protein LOC126608199 isoform X2 [Malus sylvestris]|uniref:uncharacterized protein LOC126608199 isoform X2 n=1 Tax=Malus sylvestris TaxID=3752 RepID=UPI0021ABE06D|nr:uncharacterized protein LOC126608199 isoform X2 [Malus sylvestris]
MSFFFQSRSSYFSNLDRWAEHFTPWLLRSNTSIQIKPFIHTAATKSTITEKSNTVRSWILVEIGQLCGDFKVFLRDFINLDHSRKKLVPSCFEGFGPIAFESRLWVNKMVKDIDRSEQQILGGVLVKNLRELIKARHDEKNEGTIKKYSDTAPGPNTKKSVKIEKTRFGLRVYGKGPNRNKLVVHTIYPPENRSNSPKEQVPLDEAV